MNEATLHDIVQGCANEVRVVTRASGEISIGHRRMLNLTLRWLRLSKPAPTALRHVVAGGLRRASMKERTPSAT